MSGTHRPLGEDSDAPPRVASRGGQTARGREPSASDPSRRDLPASTRRREVVQLLAPSERFEVEGRGVEERKARLEAEQAYRRGLRHLWAQRFQKALEELNAAAEGAADLLEYQLGALWAGYRCTRDPEELILLQPKLADLAKRAAIQDRSLAFPPYVLAHMALLQDDDERAFRLFRVAAYRDADNVDAQRYVRILSARLQLE